MKHLATTSILLLLGFSLWSQTLSSQARVSLLTCEPGDELYSAFGHSALRVRDPLTNIDRVYNYGTFEFGEGFYMKFTRGKLNYFLNSYTFRLFNREYRYYKRSFDEQVMDLDSADVQAIFDFVENNALDENKYYLYDFFFDNCATRIRDVFFDVLGEKAQWTQRAESGKTFRGLLDEYLDGSPWADFGIDLALGAVIDKPATKWDQMFLPDYLASNMAEVLVDNGNGQKASLVDSKRNLYLSGFDRLKSPWYMYPVLWFGLLLAVVAFFTLRNWGGDYRGKAGDITLFSIAGIAGLILTFLTFGTDHTATAQNWNILWLLPTHLVAGLLLIRQEKFSWLKWYWVGTAGLIGLLILGWWVFPQQFHIANVPLMLLLGLRAGVIWKKGEK
ncbi:MAG: DUF4105 domain-containing protein [Bacteroidota bacterium]